MSMQIKNALTAIRLRFWEEDLLQFSSPAPPSERNP